MAVFSDLWSDKMFKIPLVKTYGYNTIFYLALSTV